MSSHAHPNADHPQSDTVVVIGAGYVGLVTGVALARGGHRVTLVEIDAVRRATLEDGRAPIYEPGLDALLSEVLESGLLKVTGDVVAALTEHEAPVVVAAVGTPQMEDGRADLTALNGVIETLGRHAVAGTVLAIKSTVPPGTAVRVQRRLSAAGSPLSVVSCPEFLREGSALEDIRDSPRTVVGGTDAMAVERVAALMNLSGGAVVRTNNTSAELIKYGSNAFLAMKISFINEMANLCDSMGGDIDQVSLGMGLDPRIGKAFLNAGLGFGGSCFPKDVRALEHVAAREGYSFWMLKTALEVNEQQRIRFVSKLRDAIGGDLHGRRIAMLGLAFKPGTDDMRAASSITIAQRLVELGAEVVVHDPVATPKARAVMPAEVIFASTPYEAVRGTHAIALITDWADYRALDWVSIRESVAYPIVVDGRNCLDAAHLTDIGFDYHAMGRGSTVVRRRRRASDGGDTEEAA